MGKREQRIPIDGLDEFLGGAPELFGGHEFLPGPEVDRAIRDARLSSTDCAPAAEAMTPV